MRTAWYLKRLFLLLLLSAVCFSVAAVDKVPITGDGSAIINRYKISTNAIERRYAINELKSFTSQNVPLWAKDLLSSALKDKDPIVVEESVFQIANLQVSDFSTRLITMFNNSEQLYAGYSIRLQYALVSTLGKTGGAVAKTFISQQLAKDNGTDLGEFLLAAVVDLKDAAMIKDLQGYSVKMGTLVEQMKKDNVDPIFYSRHLWYIQLCAEIEQALAAKGGK